MRIIDNISAFHINNINDLSLHFISEVKHSFEEYKKLEDETVRVEEFRTRKLQNK